MIQVGTKYSYFILKYNILVCILKKKKIQEFVISKAARRHGNNKMSGFSSQSQK